MTLKGQLDQITEDLSVLSTESILVVGSILILLTGIVSKSNQIQKLTFGAVLLVAIGVNVFSKSLGLALSDSLFIEYENVLFTSLFLGFGLILLTFHRQEHSNEFYFLILSLMVGASFMMKANSLLLIYISIELVSLVSYALTAFSFTAKGLESSVKYLIFGAVSSAFMLMGLGLIYGSGGLYLSIWTNEAFDVLPSQIGLLLLIFGIFFKIGIFPFHIWIPATYQTGPIDAVAIISIVPKLAGVVLLRRVIVFSGLNSAHWIMDVVLVAGIATMVLGTLSALRQTHTRRMISFGSVAHSGFILGFIIVPQTSYNFDAFWYYSVVYGLMNLGVFYMIDCYEKLGTYLNQGYQSTRNQWVMGSMFTLVLMSLVGLPPLAGFSAKLFLFSSIWQTFEVTSSNLVVTYFFVAVLTSVVALFFYLQVPRNIFLSSSTKIIPESSKIFSLRAKFISTIFGITLLILFFVPKFVMSLAHLLNSTHE